ncbi:thiol peroxidase [Botrimarina mediterranea]|uniref:Putative thiol peroxidase n=1 Tax=Botrimarina mediterranea TaxID=2528022 RepID=A0A518KF09_9BACT|nr:thiol peroxidase [Botrimarina mediterranea]QDV76381.1 putative thiol peroxidase [Botrimarina mediterranea]QDV80978.1 putative thiol peroxidase [Planctomycetes bacterium K2D]
MSRSGAITFKGAPMTLAGDAIAAGQAAPDFTCHYFEGGMKSLGLSDLKGKATILSVVPSLDTGVCATQTKTFNDKLSSMADKVNAVTISLDLPFAMNRFCGAEDIKNLKVASDYQERSFGNAFGTLIEELKILCRAVFVLDKDGKVTYVEYVPEVTSEPDYTKALAALEAAAA